MRANTGEAAPAGYTEENVSCLKPGQRQLLGPDRAAGRVGGLEHEHLTAGLGEPDRGARARSGRRR